MIIPPKVKTHLRSAPPPPDEKDAKAIKAYFKSVYPDMDFDRVYASDMKKMVKWLAILKLNNVELKLTEAAETEEEGNEEATA